METAFKSSEEARGTKMSKLFQLLLYLCTVSEFHGQFEGSGYTEVSYNEVIPEDTWNTLQVQNRNPHWCHSLSLSNGEVICFPPNGGRYRTSLGTHCLQSCHHGYRLVGRASVRCMENRRWSGSGHCRQIRCHVLPLIDHGTYICTNDVAVDSRCDYACNKGYELEGDRTRTCLEAGEWSGTEPACVDNDPPTIKCPPSRVRIAGPGRRTAKVSWEPPVVKDSTEATLKAVILTGQEPGSNFKEGIHTIRYKVYDQARNKAACKFIVRVEVRRCEELKAPQHGYLTCSSDKNNYGAICQYHCDGGYDRRGTQTRVCQFNRNWSMSAPVCVPMEINTDVRSVAALLDQFYEKRRLLIVSTPDSSNHYYKLQNLMLQKAGCGLDLRQVTVIELIGLPPREVGRIKDRKLNSEVIEGLRQALRISRGYFSMVLLDEHGIDHERFISPATSEELYYIIEFNLMDEEERERLEKKRDYCE